MWMLAGSYAALFGFSTTKVVEFPLPLLLPPLPDDVAVPPLVVVPWDEQSSSVGVMTQTRHTDTQRHRRSTGSMRHCALCGEPRATVRLSRGVKGELLSWLLSMRDGVDDVVHGEEQHDKRVVAVIGCECGCSCGCWC